MEQCISLYLNEKERNKLYHWKDILYTPVSTLRISTP